jgi:hypothetical protein
MTQTPLDDLLDPTPDGPDGTSRPAEDDNGFDDEFGAPSGRRRLPLFTTILVTGIVIALSFTGGVLVQKRATSSSSSTAGGLPNFGGGGGGFPSGFPGGGGGAGAGTGTTPGSTGSGSTSTVPVLVGTVVKASPTEVTVKDLGGTTHVVRTTDATKVTTVTTVPITKLTAGQSVTVNGTKTSDGSIDATAVSAR